MSQFMENLLRELVNRNIMESLCFLVDRTEKVIEGNHIDYEDVINSDCLETKKFYFNRIFNCLCDDQMKWTRILVGFAYMKIIIERSLWDSEHYYQWSQEVILL